MKIPAAPFPPPALTAAQMAEVDRLMVETLGIDLVRMMENAGRALARLAVERFLGGRPDGRRVVVLAGKGGNGGGALVAARRLSGWGARALVGLSASPGELAPVPAAQLQILERMGVGVRAAGLSWGVEGRGGRSFDDTALGEPSAGGEVDLILDGLVGYSLFGAPRGRASHLIEWANRQGCPVLSLDVPSGLDANSGEARQPTVTATATLTLALPKTGLWIPGARRWTGELYLADIGVPDVLYERLGYRVRGLFSAGDILSLEGVRP